mgnify:CR=1 FL=1|jgi:4-hydroxy-tetrahydrodipicolinate synthase
MGYSDLKTRLKHVAFTTATPFTPDGADVAREHLAENLQAVADAGGRLFLPCGNTGEYDSLTDDERVAVVETHVDTLGADATVVGGVGGSLGAARELIDRYERAGADAVMVMPPDHTYAHERGLVEYYESLAAATDLGLVVYKRGPRVTSDVLFEISTLENVVGMKYAVNDVAEFARMADSVPGDIVWLNGIAERFAPSFGLEGADGFTTGVGNFVPEATLALFGAIRAGDWDRARRVRNLLTPYENLRDEPGEGNRLDSAYNIPAVKYGMELAGLYGGPVRPPLAGLSDEAKERARDQYERIASTDFDSDSVRVSSAEPS